MSDRRGKTCQMESVRLKINEHLTAVGEEISCVLENQLNVKLVRVVVLERFSAAAEFMFNLFQREMETLETALKRENKLLHLMLQPHIRLHRAGWLMLHSHYVTCLPLLDSINISYELQPLD